MADKRLEDHDQALDAAVDEYRRIVKAGHWNWSNFEHEPSQQITSSAAKFDINSEVKDCLMLWYKHKSSSPVSSASIS